MVAVTGAKSFGSKSVGALSCDELAKLKIDMEIARDPYAPAPPFITPRTHATCCAARCAMAPRW